jgi:hypothetical protein
VLGGMPTQQGALHSTSTCARAGAIIAILANSFVPESPLRPTKILRKAVSVVGKLLNRGAVDLDETQRELLKGNERLFSAKDLVCSSLTLCVARRPALLPSRAESASHIL